MAIPSRQCDRTRQYIADTLENVYKGFFFLTNRQGKNLYLRFQKKNMALQQCLNQLALVAVDMRLHGPWLEGITTHCGDVYGLMLWEGPNFYPVGGRVGLVTMVGNALGRWIGRREQWHNWRELAEDLIGELGVSGLLPGHDENVNLQICNTLRQVVNGLLTITAVRRNKDRLTERLVNMVYGLAPRPN